MIKNKWTRYSNGGTNCVEARELTDGSVEVRDSKDLTKAPLRFTASEWWWFTAGVRAGKFDLSTGE